MAATETALASGHPTETWAALVGSVTLVVALVGVLYNRLNGDIKAHDVKLDTGALSFIALGNQLVSTGEQIKSLCAAIEGENTEIGQLDKSLRDLHTRLTVIETEHRHCQAMLEQEGRA